jgi:dTDP-4-amino-4,6-dideoxygalactose transaminase
MAVAERHGLTVIEDCAQAHGAVYKGRKVGTIGDAGAFSFQASKATSAFEGGALITNRRELYQRAVLLSMHPARQGEEVAGCDLAAYRDSTAFNYRMNSLAAAMAKSQLGFLDERNAWRIRNVERLYGALDGVPGLTPVRTPEDRVNVYHLAAFRYDAAALGGLPRERFIAAARAEGVPLGHYVDTPIHLRPRFRDRFFYPKGCPWRCGHAARDVAYRRGDCPVAEEAAETDLTLYTGHLADDRTPLIDQLAAALRKVAAHAGDIPPEGAHAP